MKGYLRSVRTRLTLWYAAVMVTTILLFSVGVYVSVRTSLMRQVENELTQNIAMIETLLKNEPDELHELEEYGSVPLFRVSETGDMLHRTADWQQIGLDRALQHREVASPWIWETPEDVHFLVGVAELRVGNRTLEVAAAEEIEAMLQSLRSLAVILLIGSPIAVALALLSGYLMAGRALAPVGKIAAKAQEITADRLSERLPVDNPEDEFGRLATIFNRTLERLEHAFENLRRFTADASHELRTPLTALRSVGEVGLQEGIRSPAFYRDVIGSMLEETDRLAVLVEGLLTLTRGDAGGVSVETERVDLGGLAREVVDHLRVLAEEKSQEIDLHVVPLSAISDGSKLRQALINLLDNTIKYTPPGGRIEVRVRPFGADEVAMEVSDTGPGIPPEHQDKVFERFYRIDPGRSSASGGTGLGLAIAQWAVRLCGGRIELESQEGEGSTFRIVLPGAPSAASPRR